MLLKCEWMLSECAETSTHTAPHRVTLESNVAMVRPVANACPVNVVGNDSLPLSSAVCIYLNNLSMHKPVLHICTYAMHFAFVLK